MIRKYDVAPSRDDLDSIAESALATIPEGFRHHFDNVVIRVEELCDEDIERELELESPYDLSGLYQGVPLAGKSIAATPQNIDMIFLFRLPILLEWCESGEDLHHLVRHVLIHEMGHHLGLSDEAIERIESED